MRPASAHNAQVVRLGRLSTRRKARDDEGVIVLDGPVLLSEALDAGINVSHVFVDAERISSDAQVVDRAADQGARVISVTSEVLRRATDPVHPQACAAIAKRPDERPTLLETARAVLVLVGVSDPGNAGTLARAAAAAGFDALIATAGSVDLFAPKTLRSSAGALCHLPVISLGAPLKALGTLQTYGFVTFASSADGNTEYTKVDFTERCALLVGNEAHGLDPHVAGEADYQVSIPMAGSVESLNVAMAGTVLCFEVWRQGRRLRSTKNNEVEMEETCLK